MKPLGWLALGCVGLALAACQSQAGLPRNTPAATLLITDTQAASASAAWTPSPAASPTPWPGYPEITLAPFPLSAEQLQPTTAPVSSATSLSAPIALGPYDHFYLHWPLSQHNLPPSQRYGVFQETGDNSLPHLGLDVSLNAGTPVLAAGAGEVVWADYGLFYRSPSYLEDPYGISVAIRHSFGHQGQPLYTIYAHLRETRVMLGDQVVAGQVIGLSGNTGQSSGPHLHFEVRLGENSVYFTHNPELWIAPTDGYGVLVGRITDTRDFPLMNRLVEVRNLADRRRINAYSYATQTRLLPDGYYNENFVLGELPPGRYEIAIPHFGIWKRTEVEIRPGAVTYFRFSGNNGYNFDLPASALPGNTP
ncbi:MAG: peptidoglycan DD-metalloendopeptidase family protein [Anaerolineales bacterium]|nr:peptidoglycan DD-metalloendopeptidase family protein [Anaerolineales bacterium]MCW5856147.1 peptidoglycan DD-metalloendopeptidase family protein [Anaerolineales bacterium]